MALHNAASFACSYAKCRGGTELLCIYDKRGAEDGRILYPQAVDASKACNGCSTAAPCVNRLCQAKIIPATEAPSLCKFGGTTSDMSETALNMHNYYRRLLASGWAVDKFSVYAPPAKRMLPLKYDCNSEQSLGYEAAQKSAECVYPPNPPQLATRSQNYLKIDDYETDPLDALQQAIKIWWGELAEYGVATNTTYTAEMKAAGNLKNYVNMAFDQTTLVGCAVETCRRKGFTMVISVSSKVAIERNERASPEASMIENVLVTTITS
ncbi:SCP-like protein [Ancylostoma caninum]|uniref:SCP-like protein n=1 Tax=Ancylostoma caninum TaxID=29170 RepID=A0A368GFR3_ANCCA|nr:SCP-like protein [Ancylostoma caninum]